MIGRGTEEWGRRKCASRELPKEEKKDYPEKESILGGRTLDYLFLVQTVGLLGLRLRYWVIILIVIVVIVALMAMARGRGRSF